MKLNSFLNTVGGVVASLALGIGLSLLPTVSWAANVPFEIGYFPEVSATNGSTLNDLIRRIPAISPRTERELAGLSAIQEQMMVHERKMRGEGLPPEFQARFSANYAAIVSAITEDRITMNYGRELLSVHRQLLEKAFCWNAKGAKDVHYGEVVVLALEELRDELAGNAEPLKFVPDCVRTPVIKGHQLWIEELVQSGCYCPALSRGELGALRIEALRLERFEGYYKRDGHLTRIERENLHERLIALNRSLIDILRR